MAARLKLGGQLFAVALVAGLFALLVWKLVQQKRSTATSLIRSGKTGPAPNFHLPRLDADGKLSLASLRGKPVVINFWQSSCDPCKSEAKTLEAAYQKYRGRIAFVGVDVYDFASDARRFAKRYGITYPLVHDVSGSTLDTYGLTGYPETFFVNRRGKLIGIHIAAQVNVKPWSDEFEQGLKLALAS